MLDKPKILILGKLPPPYIGPAIATNIILNSSLKERYELIHLDTRINKDVATMGRWGWSKLFRSIGIYITYNRMIKQHNPDLILIPISQTTMGFLKDLPFIKIAGWKKKKVVVQLRGSNLLNWLQSASGFTNRIFSKAMKRCSGAIVLGQNLKYLFKSYFPEDRIAVVPNGANYEIQERKNPRLSILYLANFLPSKSFDDVLKAIAIVNKNCSIDFELKAAGAWDNNEFKLECEQIIKDKGLTNVNLLPVHFGKEKMQLFADSDVFVFCPKMPEGLPWVIIEAMSNGLPVIATDQGAIIEVVDHHNGFIVPPSSPEVIADKLILLLEDEEKRKAMGLASIKKYEEQLTEDSMADAMSRAWNSFLRG